jgi:protein SCO1/2
MTRALHRICVFAVVLLSRAAVMGQAARPAILNDVRIDQKLNVQVPLDLRFRDERGRDVRLGDYFGKRPMVLALVYYRCPMLCTMVLNDLTRDLNSVTLTAGKDFDVLAVSFDPSETPDLAAVKKATYLSRYRKPDADDGWHFLTGSQESITKLTDAVGFHYVWDPQYQVFAHASGIIVLTPEGKTARYFFGIDYEPVDLRLSLVEATGGRIAEPTDQVLLYCFHYDPRTGKYGLLISRVIQLSGMLMVLVLGSSVGLMLRRERRMR